MHQQQQAKKNADRPVQWGRIPPAPAFQGNGRGHGHHQTEIKSSGLHREVGRHALGQ